jgi:hypothetical protein
MIEAFACEALSCAALIRDSLADCERKRCCFAWQRRGREDRARREEADRRETVHPKKGKNTMPPQYQGEPMRAEGGAVPPHSAGVVPVPGGRVGEPAAPVVGQICPPGGRDGKSLLCDQQVGALEVQSYRDVPGAGWRPFPPEVHPEEVSCEMDNLDT